MNMHRRQLLTAGVAAGVAATATSARANDDRDDDDIVGSWFGTVTATNPPLGSFNDLISFHTGGVVIESRRYLVPGTPFGNLLETTGHGAWERSGRNTFKAFFRFLLQSDTTGAPIGTDTSASHRNWTGMPIRSTAPSSRRSRTWPITSSSPPPAPSRRRRSTSDQPEGFPIRRDDEEVIPPRRATVNRDRNEIAVHEPP
jgi:hypothetical protein